MSQRPTPISQSRFLTADEAAAYLRLSPKTLEKHRSVGSGPRFKRFGRIVRYTIHDLDVWAETHTFAMSSEARRGS